MIRIALALLVTLIATFLVMRLYRDGRYAALSIVISVFLVLCLIVGVMFWQKESVSVEQAVLDNIQLTNITTQVDSNRSLLIRGNVTNSAPALTLTGLNINLRLLNCSSESMSNIENCVQIDDSVVHLKVLVAPKETMPFKSTYHFPNQQIPQGSWSSEIILLSAEWNK